MSQPKQVVLALTVRASGAITGNRFVAYSGAQAGAAENTVGVAQYQAEDGQYLAVDTIGTTVVESGALIAVGEALEVDLLGRAVPQVAGPMVARALQAATGAGEFIEVLLLVN